VQWRSKSSRLGDIDTGTVRILITTDYLVPGDDIAAAAMP
jgi:hypothetical protein